MKYDHLKAFEKSLETLPKQPQPVYLIIGKEGSEASEAIQLLLRTLLPSPEAKELSLKTCDGSQLETAELTNLLYSQSFFVKTTIIFIQQAEKLKKNTQQDIEKFLTRSSSNILLLSALSFSKQASLYQAIEQKGTILECPELKPWEKEKSLAEWVNKQLMAERKVMAYPVCQALVKQVGGDRASVAQEVEKLICYCWDKKEVTLQDVQAICTRQSTDSIWQLGEAIFQRDTRAALTIMQALLFDGQPLLPLLRQIRSQFQIEFQVALLLAQGKVAADITREFPYMKGQILERHIRHAQGYGMEAFKRGLLALDAAEMRLKNSSIDETLMIDFLIYELTGV